MCCGVRELDRDCKALSKTQVVEILTELQSLSETLGDSETQQIMSLLRITGEREIWAKTAIFIVWAQGRTASVAEADSPVSFTDGSYWLNRLIGSRQRLVFLKIR